MKKRILSMGMVASMILSMGIVNAAAEAEGGVPTLDQIVVGEDYLDIEAEITVLTDRTDICDTVYAGYAEMFSEIYPGIKVTYEGVTDYEQSLTLRLMTGDWGDICFIPSTVDKSEMSEYFIALGDFETMDATYNFVQGKTFDGTVYGICNGGNLQEVRQKRR